MKLPRRAGELHVRESKDGIYHAEKNSGYEFAVPIQLSRLVPLRLLSSVRRFNCNVVTLQSRTFQPIERTPWTIRKV